MAQGNPVCSVCPAQPCFSILAKDLGTFKRASSVIPGGILVLYLAGAPEANATKRCHLGEGIGAERTLYWYKGWHLMVHGPLGPAVRAPNPLPPAWASCQHVLPPGLFLLPLIPFLPEGLSCFSFPVRIPSRIQCWGQGLCLFCSSSSPPCLECFLEHIRCSILAGWSKLI